jgi:hypothetical protein
MKWGTFQAQEKVFTISANFHVSDKVSMPEVEFVLSFQLFLSRNQMSGQQQEIIFSFDLDGAFLWLDGYILTHRHACCPTMGHVWKQESIRHLSVMDMMLIVFWDVTILVW